MSVLHLYCLQRAHWELTDSIFHASAAGEDFNGTVFFPCSPFFSSKNSQRKKITIRQNYLCGLESSRLNKQN